MKFYQVIVAVIGIIMPFCVVFANMREEKMADGMVKMSFETPDMDDDEVHSPFMPDLLKCDACEILAYQLFIRFQKFNGLHKYLKYDVPESEVLDMFEETCTVETFENYGLKNYEGVNRLSGPGSAMADVPGVLSGGGKWPSRIIDMCQVFAGDVGEPEVYNGYKKNPKSLKSFKKYLCHGEKQLGNCKAGKKDEL